MTYYIGADLGTSSLKLLLVASDGQVYRQLSQNYEVHYPQNGWSEQSPADWWEALATLLPRLIEGVDPDDIRAIGVAGQMHGLVVLDGQDEVIRPTILWNDNRTARQTDYLNEVIGKQRLSDETANVAFAGFTAPKLLWLKENEPDNFARIAKIMLPKDYLNYRLTGVHATDFSDASGMLLLDVQNKRWSDKMLALCSVRQEQMPRLYESFEVIGTLRDDVAATLGLSPNTAVIAGAGDNAAAAIGTGTIGEGKCNISLGTSGTVFISCDRFSAPEQNALHAFCHADGHYHLMGCMLSAASCNRWFCRDILGTEDYDALFAAVDPATLGQNSVYFLPYLMGERCPVSDPDARGVFVGMTPDTTREQMALAVMEGVSFALRDNVEAARAVGVRVEQSTLCGGGAKSALWRKMLAAVLNVRLTLPECEEGPGYGTAMLAMVATGEYETLAECARALLRSRETVEVDTDLAARYESRYRTYRKLYPAMKQFFKEMRN